VLSILTFLPVMSESESLKGTL